MAKTVKEKKTDKAKLIIETVPEPVLQNMGVFIPSGTIKVPLKKQYRYDKKKGW